MGRKPNAPAPHLVYGGQYQKSRAGRQGPRPLSFHQTMHIAMRSSLAKGEWNFRRDGNMKKIDGILKKFAARHGVTLRKYAIQHNHLHLHVKVPSTRNYKRFIRAVTGAIAMAVGRMSRWTKKRFQFWDRRPFSRVVKGERARVRMDNYVRLNELEAWGIPRAAARVYLPFLPDN